MSTVYTQRENQTMVSLINDYSLFGTTDGGRIKMLSAKLGKDNNEKILKTLLPLEKSHTKEKTIRIKAWLSFKIPFCRTL